MPYVIAVIILIGAYFLFSPYQNCIRNSGDSTVSQSVNQIEVRCDLQTSW